MFESQAEFAWKTSRASIESSWIHNFRSDHLELMPFSEESEDGLRLEHDAAEFPDALMEACAASGGQNHPVIRAMSCGVSYRHEYECPMNGPRADVRRLTERHVNAHYDPCGDGEVVQLSDCIDVTKGEVMDGTVTCSFNNCSQDHGVRRRCILNNRPGCLASLLMALLGLSAR